MRFDNALREIPGNKEVLVNNQYSAPDTGLINNLDIFEKKIELISKLNLYSP